MSDDAFLRMQDFVGMAYEPGVFDCWDFAALVLRQVFGRTPMASLTRNRPQGTAGQRREILSLRDRLAVKVDVPFTGCGVLLTEPEGPVVRWHIGLIAMHAGETWVLHNSASMGGSRMSRLTDLHLRWGMRLEGFYAWK